MELMKRSIVGLTFFTCSIAVVLLCVAFGTNYWIMADANKLRLRGSTLMTTPLQLSSTPETNINGRFEGSTHFGLFQGFQSLNPAFGFRPKDLYITCLLREAVCMWSKLKDANSRHDEIQKEYNCYFADSVNDTVCGTSEIGQAGFLDFKLWVVTVTFLALSVAFGLLGAVFAAFNTITTPVECLTGVRGLYVWNIVADVFGLISLLVWVVMFYTKLDDNVMPPEDLRNGWSSKSKARFGYSFWIILGALLLFMLNCVLLFVSSRESERQKRTNVIVNEKPADGIIMLY